MKKEDNQELIDDLNKIVASLGLLGQSRRNSLVYWNPPRGWTGTAYLFGYTPWRTTDPKTGRRGFFAVKYRRLRDGNCKLVKSVRFGKRKTAKARSAEWYNGLYLS